MQKCFVETVMTMLGTIVKEEFHQHNTAIDAIAAYCHFQESGTITILYRRPPIQVKETHTQLVAADTEKRALSTIMLLVFKKTRPTICFVYLEEASLLFEKHMYSFVGLGDLTKHFK